MSYIQDKDKTSSFYIANLSKLTCCKRFIKWWPRVRFVVAKCSVFWNYISEISQTAENKKFGNNHVQFIPILNRAIKYIMIHGLLLFRKISKIYKGLKGHCFI